MPISSNAILVDFINSLPNLLFSPVIGTKRPILIFPQGTRKSFDDRLAKINPNYEQDTKTNNAFLQKALDKLGENKKNRFPIESFIKEKIDLQDRASQGLEIGDFRKSLLESKKESLDNLDIPSKVKAAYAKSYEKYYKGMI